MRLSSRAAAAALCVALAFAAGVPLLLAAPSAALADASTTVPTAPVWDFLQPYLLTLFSLAVTAVVGWLAAALRAKWGIEIDLAHSQAIQDAAMNAAGLILRKASAALPANVDLKHPLIALAVQYVGAAVPAAVAHFGLTPEEIAEKVLAKISQLAPPARVEEVHA